MTADTSFFTDPLVGAATKITRKPGQRWEYGPICFAGERKAYVTDLATYLQWVGQVESALSDPAGTAQRIRMLYYGGAAGYLPELDTLLVSNPTWAGAPLTTADVPQDTLDGLMGTGWVSVGVNQDRRRLVDISHVWLLLDAAFNKVSGLGQQVVQTSLTGLMSWACHLASWWIEYNAQKICAQRALPAGQTLTEDPANLTVPALADYRATGLVCDRRHLRRHGRRDPGRARGTADPGSENYARESAPGVLRRQER